MNLQEFIQAPAGNDLLYSAGAFFIVLAEIFLLGKIKRNTKSARVHSERFGIIFHSLFLGILPLFVQSYFVLMALAVLLFAAVWLFKKTKSTYALNLFDFLNRSSILLFSYFVLIILFGKINSNLILIALTQIALAELAFPYTWKGQGRGQYISIDLKTPNIFGAILFLIFSFTLNYFYYSIRLFNVVLPILSIFIASFLLLIIFLFASSDYGIFYLSFSTGLILFIFTRLNHPQVLLFFEGFALAALVGFISFKIGFLSLSGSLMTFLLATFIFGLGGWAWAVPILTFFILSSLLSKFGKKQKQRFKNTFEKSGVRDYAQVLANGGIPGILMILNFIFPHDFFYSLYLLSLAVATADTWSTELGVLSKSRPVLITTLKKVDPGISGAISLIGTLGGLVGAFLVILSGYLFARFSLTHFLLLLIFSLLGDFLDSLIGATLQGQYQCNVCSKYTEKKMHCSKPTKLIQGYRIIDNDTVNLSANLLALFLFLAIIHF